VATGLDKIDEPATLVELRSLVDALLRRVDLPISIRAVLLAEACNIGLEPLVRNDLPWLTRGRLSWFHQNYLRAETLTQANARLVDCQATLAS